MTPSQITAYATIQIEKLSSDSLDELFVFCKEESKEDSPAAKNMWSENWRSSSNTLPYILTKINRFREPKGSFFILRDDGKIIGCAGVYISDFDDKVAIAGVRTWISKPYRRLQLMKNFLLVEHKKWAIEHGAQVVAITFNDYNKDIIKMFERGKKTGKRTEHHLFHDNFNVLDFPVVIQNTPQFVAYENLGSYNFNWMEIKA